MKAFENLADVEAAVDKPLGTTDWVAIEQKVDAFADLTGDHHKDPAVRLQVLEDAGRLNVPFTTGLLVGIEESFTERAETVFAIRAASRRLGHVQERCARRRPA